MHVPDDLLYSTDHEWIERVEGGVRIGITDYAQDALGDVVFVQVPTVGTSLSAGDSFSEVESTKSVSDIYAPISGVVTTVNESLAQDPSVVNTDPYGAGWLCVIEPASATDVDQLLDAEAYRALTES
jgi:glycine cleavage system H protein